MSLACPCKEENGELEVLKGENLTKIGKKFGVSVEHLQKMNNIKDKNKISEGQILWVNPEANFSDNPVGGYHNPDNTFGGRNYIK